jgi:hypothetical protein
MVDNDEKIVKILESMDKRLTGLEQGQERTNTALEAVRAGVEDVQAKQKEQPTKQDVETTVDAAKIELKADMLMLESKVVKKIQSHERRITNIEDQEHMKNPEKN